MFPFLTAYDPAGKSTVSIDPLGSLQSYLGLANLILPGITTITTRSRYLSMMCWALGNAERYRRFSLGPGGQRERRKSVLPYERLWALACVSAGHREIMGAMDGLRGFRRASRQYRNLVQRPSKVTPDFDLLRSQERTGAVGTYWTALVGGDLIDPDSGALMPEGTELSEYFPPPPLTTRDLQRLTEPTQAHRVAISFDELVDWSDECHLAAAAGAERARLAEVLTSNDRRDCMASALRLLASERRLPDEWTISALGRLRKALTANEAACRLALPDAVDAIIAMERFHEAVLSIFASLLWWGTERPDRPVAQLITEAEFHAVADWARETAQALLQWRSEAERLEVRQAVDGMAVFAAHVARTDSARSLTDEILRWHHRVQSGKLDGGVPKRDWITMAGGDRVLRPSPLYQRTERPEPPRGRRLTHPYRIEQFVQMLQENGALPSG